MKRTLVCALLVTACGDDGAAAGDGDDSGSSSGHGTTHGDETTSATASASAETTDTLESSSSSVGGDTTTSGSESSTTAGDTSESSDGESSTTGEPGTGCLPPEIFAAIDQHAHDLAATAGLLATHPSENEVTGFMLAPGLESPPALAAQFAGPLVMTCSDPLLYDEFCEEGRCSQIECTGDGAGWINHMWIEPAFAGVQFSFDEVHIHLLWSGGDGTLVDITTTSTGPGGEDMSMTGEGQMDVDSMFFTETFPALHPAGITVLDYADDAGGYSGQLTIADVIVAEVDDLGHLVSTGDCP